MQLEQSIYNVILSKIGVQENIKGISIDTFRKMKYGKSGMSTTTLKKVFQANGIEGSITLKYGNTTTTIDIK